MLIHLCFFCSGINYTVSLYICFHRQQANTGLRSDFGVRRLQTTNKNYLIQNHSLYTTTLLITVKTYEIPQDIEQGFMLYINQNQTAWSWKSSSSSLVMLQHKLQGGTNSRCKQLNCSLFQSPEATDCLATCHLLHGLWMSPILLPWPAARLELKHQFFEAY